MMKSIKTFMALLLGVALGLAGGVLIGFVVPKLGGLDTETDTSHSKIVQAVKAEKEVVLMSLGIQGLTEENSHGTIFGHRVPLTGRQKMIQYSYKAKLGVDGEDVELEDIGSKIVVHVPEFKFIGHSDEEFKTAIDNNGVLSWATADIDTAESISKILTDDARQENIDDNRQFLEEQAKNFYTGIIHSVDPELRVEYSFAKPE